MVKQVIGRLLYDTEKATVIAEAGDAFSSDDFRYEWETLYKTAKGRWFLHGEGGALSKYAQNLPDNGTVGSWRISAMTDVEVMDWLERHNIWSVMQDCFPSEVEEA
jgi:hypothetical protein